MKSWIKEKIKMVNILFIIMILLTWVWLLIISVVVYMNVRLHMSAKDCIIDLDTRISKIKK